ncbi:hypothetical protein [Sediminimonas qiaohouensis]|uniref:hypothetical protein n=1 Tax=Sediminimonas qiaohouensis TaxID=552061 RepID=UPI001B7FD78F|nr:hypothetical protein [Sediminimonas qiaohouensis]
MVIEQVSEKSVRFRRDFRGKSWIDGFILRSNAQPFWYCPANMQQSGFAPAI